MSKSLQFGLQCSVRANNTILDPAWQGWGAAPGCVITAHFENFDFLRFLKFLKSSYFLIFSELKIFRMKSFDCCFSIRFDFHAGGGYRGSGGVSEAGEGAFWSLAQDRRSEVTFW